MNPVSRFRLTYAGGRVADLLERPPYPVIFILSGGPNDGIHLHSDPPTPLAGRPANSKYDAALPHL